MMAQPTVSRFTPPQLQILVFLVLLPAANWVLLVSILHDMGAATVGRGAVIAGRLWLVFGVSLVFLRLIRLLVPALLHPDRFWRQLITHGVVVVGVAMLLVPPFSTVAGVLQPQYMALPRLFLFMQVTVYLAVVWMLRQQELRFATVDRLKEAQLSVLRSQSNPHFLFNTLNLITAEISQKPANAKEIVFDLADLLRANLRLAERPWVSVTEEMRLVELYLRLQQRRFQNRLTFSMELDPTTLEFLVPSLLLQPVIENTIKWAVAPYPDKAHIDVRTSVTDDRWSIEIKDTAPPFNDQSINEGDGFRILRRTLELQYPNDYSLSLRSTNNGGLFRLNLPIPQTRVSEDSE